MISNRKTVLIITCGFMILLTTIKGQPSSIYRASQACPLFRSLAYILASQPLATFQKRNHLSFVVLKPSGPCNMKVIMLLVLHNDADSFSAYDAISSNNVGHAHCTQTQILHHIIRFPPPIVDNLTCMSHPLPGHSSPSLHSSELVIVSV